MPDNLTPTETRQIESKLVAWCRDCDYHVGIEEVGGRCIGDGECQRTLIRRRFWVCSECGCHYVDKAEAEGHECYECY